VSAPAPLSASDGTPLHVHRWPAPHPRAVVLVSHGLGEHGGRYARLAAALVVHGISVYAVDHRGHGRSGGVRGHVSRFSQYTDDFEAFRRHVEGEAPADVPRVLLGHSLGGLIALRYLQTHPGAPFAAAVLSAPLLAALVRAPRWKTALAGVLSRLAPSLRLANELDPAGLSTDDAYVRTYRDDPLVHPWITPRLYTELLGATAAARAEGGALRIPLLFVLPGADPIVDASVSGAFAEGLSGDVTLRRYPEMRHEAHNERDRARVEADVAAFVLRHGR
jgi:alpha-beta hydrolase superfamily lysophospholipase